MDIQFIDMNPDDIRENYPDSFHEQARYFKVLKNGNPLCCYGIISHPDQLGEAFLIMKTFQGKVLSKGFFLSLFEHAFSLGYREVYTWTSWDRLIRLFRHFEKLGIEPTGCPPWDTGSIATLTLKTWFMKKIP